MISLDQLVFLAILLVFKHMIFDFFYQPAWMLADKNRPGRGGLELHALLHSASSVLIFLLLGETRSYLLLCLFVGEFVIHYFTDFLKCRIGSICELRSDESEYWMLFGLDQLIHQFTYVVMVYIAYSWRF